jgi:hypothetical protein
MATIQVWVAASGRMKFAIRSSGAQAAGGREILKAEPSCETKNQPGNAR